ncbi:RlpA-like double-psi beta-barrel domain-containing protein [Streptomyces sp. NBC_01092]|uniref:RlpA-like double-psi beta-barrel domain-containing protein n=1 Tax=Streptomyces sp. NBC_01092 TaxID=2903748 RepID=UPI00386B3B70|nr:hypothetical protein OG254_30845 [Streptomyces sp. NBC_01092]
MVDGRQPNNDDLCKGVFVEVSYNGRTITVPVRDKCTGCAPEHLDLSKPAFQKLAPLDAGVVNGITWKFVGSGGGDVPTEPGDPGCAGLPGWDAGRSYVPGDTAAFEGRRYTATYYSTGSVPSDPASWAVWRLDGPC